MEIAVPEKQTVGLPCVFCGLAIGHWDAHWFEHGVYQLSFKDGKPHAAHRDCLKEACKREHERHRDPKVYTGTEVEDTVGLKVKWISVRCHVCGYLLTEDDKEYCKLCSFPFYHTRGRWRTRCYHCRVGDEED
nr:E6 [Equus caballus papillomavirus 10]